MFSKLCNNSIFPMNFSSSNETQRRPQQQPQPQRQSSPPATVQYRSRSAINRSLPPVESEALSRREPPPPYWVHHHHRRPVPVRLQPPQQPLPPERPAQQPIEPHRAPQRPLRRNEVNDTLSSDSDNEQQRDPNLLDKDVFCPDLLHTSRDNNTDRSQSASSAEVTYTEQHYEQIDEIVDSAAHLRLNSHRNAPGECTQPSTSVGYAQTNCQPHIAAPPTFPSPTPIHAQCVTAQIEPAQPVMGQSLSQRRPRLSLTWVLRNQNQDATAAAAAACSSAVESAAGSTVSATIRTTLEKTKIRSKSRECTERLFSERYFNGGHDELEKTGHEYSIVAGRPHGVSELLFVCSKRAANDCDESDDDNDDNGCIYRRSDRCRKSDKVKRASKLSFKNNLNNNNVNAEKTVASDKLTSFKEVNAGDAGHVDDGKAPEAAIKATISEPLLCTGDAGQSRRHRHRRRRERNRSQRFGYEIKNVDDFLSKCSLSSPGNIPVVLSSSSTLYQTRPGGYQIELPLPLGMVVNAVFKNQNWLYVQTPHAEEGYVGYAACLPLGILPQVRATSNSKPPPCWETIGDVFPKPCGNMTDSEKEIQLRGGTRSEGARTPRMKRTNAALAVASTAKPQCGERNVDVLYLRAASQPKLTEKSYAQLKATNKCYTLGKLSIGSSVGHVGVNAPAAVGDDYVLLHHKKPMSVLHATNVTTTTTTTTGSSLAIASTKSNRTTQQLRQTLLAITESFASAPITVKKGDVVTLLACHQVNDKRISQPVQWFYVRARDGTEGYIPAAVAGHGFL